MGPLDTSDPSVAPLRTDADDVKGEEVQNEPIIISLRKELADMPLCKVREVKEKLGLKLFNKAYFGTNATDVRQPIMRKKLEDEPSKCVDQNRPKEISSKRPACTFRPVYKNIKMIKKKRDPRFEQRSGLYKEKCFEDNYSFLTELRKQEVKELRKEAVECEECGDDKTAMEIRESIRRFNDWERTKAEHRLKQETYRELRQENIKRMMRGEQPVFETRAKVRMMNMEKKFSQLKKEGKLDQYLRRKSKRQAKKERKKKQSFQDKYGYK